MPLLETWHVGNQQVWVQYNSGATITLIRAGTLAKFPEDMYKLGQNRRVMCSAYVDSKTSCETMQDVEVTFMGKTFFALVIKEDLGVIKRLEIKVPQQWRCCMNSTTLAIGGRIDILAGGNLGCLFSDQKDKFEDMKLFVSNFTNKSMMFGYQGKGNSPDHVLGRKLPCTAEIKASMLGLIREDK